jgi:type IV pilus assembly protein PilB
MDEGMLARVKEANGAGSGLIIVTGRSGSGVTSTLYSLLREHDAFIQQLESVEGRPAVDLENITQHPYGDATDNVASVVAAVLRRDPNVLMVDECPDTATAELLANAAADKTLLLGMSASDTFTALAKWVKLCGDANLAAGALRAVMCQMLLRKLCPNCREAYIPNPEMLAKANLSGQRIDRFYRPPTKPLTDEKGNPIVCVACQGTGYLGRTAVFELLEVSDEIRQLIVTGATLAQIKASCRKNRMLYLQEQALQRVIDGVTSVQELIRVSQAERKS